jgi:hypothetical protein
MRFFIRSSLIVVAAMIMFGCASAGSSSEVALAKASTELNCPNDQVRVTSLGKNKYSARGCGRYVAYEYYGPRTLTSLGNGR